MARPFTWDHNFWPCVTLTLNFDLLLKNFNNGCYSVMVAAQRASLSSDNSYLYFEYLVISPVKYRVTACTICCLSIVFNSFKKLKKCMYTSALTFKFNVVDKIICVCSDPLCHIPSISWRSGWLDKTNRSLFRDYKENTIKVTRIKSFKCLAYKHPV